MMVYLFMVGLFSSVIDDLLVLTAQVFKRLHLGTVSFTAETMDDVWASLTSSTNGYGVRFGEPNKAVPSLLSLAVTTIFRQ